MIRDFFEKNPGPVLHLSPEGTILYANPVAGSLFTGNELIGNSWLAICPGLDKGNWSSLGEKMTSLRIEAEIRGTIFLFSHVWTKPDGDVLVTGTDITRQKEIEKKLEEQKATISEMARFPDMNPGPVIRMDLQGNILLSNEAATAVFGKNLLKMNWRTICTELGDETWEEVLSSGRIIPVEKMIGDKCYLFLHRTDDQKTLVFVYGSDITANKLNEKKLEEQKAVMTAMARFPDMNPGPVLRMDLRGKIILSNIASREIFGENITGKSWLRICPGLTGDQWKKMLHSEKIVPFETRIGERDFVFTHRHDVSSGLVFVYGTDVTQQKLTEKQLRHSEKMASLGEMTAGVAHEIQNPLNFVNNFSELSRELFEEYKAEHAKPPEEKDESLKTELLQNIEGNLEKIHHHGKRADAIVKGMLQHSRSTSGKKELTDINELFEEYLRLAYHAMRVKDPSFEVTIKKSFDHSLNKIHVVPQDIGRVMLNLINNAFYACTERSRDAVTEKNKKPGENYEPTVIVHTSRSPEAENAPAIIIKVCDNGTGIPGSVKDKIFQPFFTTKPTGQGTGLGLSLSYDIIKAHGGEIKVETEDGMGTDFILSLPEN